jgi:hypothetical protein
MVGQWKENCGITARKWDNGEIMAGNGGIIGKIMAGKVGKWWENNLHIVE